MKRRNYTREIMVEIKGGRIPVASIGSFTREARYEPRSKTDPMPWTDGIYRYNGREIHTVQPCGRKLLGLRTGRFTACTKPTGHTHACN